MYLGVSWIFKAPVDCKFFVLFVCMYHIHIKKIIPRIHVYINRINNRLVFKIKDGYKVESQMPETMKIFGSPKKL